MTPKRITAKFFLAPDPAAEVDLHPFIGVFHRFIQEQAVEGLLLDVADYIHVPDGPGVILIGHDVDYGLDQTNGQAGLLATRKRIESGALAEGIDDTLRKALGAMKAIESDETTSVRFATDAVQLQIFDRLAAPAGGESYESLKAEFEAAAGRLFGDHVAEVSRADAGDDRRALAARITANDSATIDSLLARLGG